MAEISFILKIQIPINLKTEQDIYDVARKEFENVGDEGLFPNHSDKDIWVNGFKEGIVWMLKNFSFKAAPLQK